MLSFELADDSTSYTHRAGSEVAGRFEPRSGSQKIQGVTSKGVAPLLFLVQSTAFTGFTGFTGFSVTRSEKYVADGAAISPKSDAREHPPCLKPSTTLPATQETTTGSLQPAMRRPLVHQPALSTSHEQRARLTLADGGPDRNHSTSKGR